MPLFLDVSGGVHLCLERLEPRNSLATQEQSSSTLLCAWQAASGTGAPLARPRPEQRHAGHSLALTPVHDGVAGLLALVAGLLALVVGLGSELAAPASLRVRVASRAEDGPRIRAPASVEL